MSSSTTTNRDDSGEETDSPVCRLLVLHSPEANFEGRARLIAGEESFELGRRCAHLGLAPSDQSLSRVHCAIRGDGASGYRVEDLGSSNGTWVNGQRVQGCTLKESDLLRVGDHLLLFQRLRPLEVNAMLSEESEPSPLVGQSPELALLRKRIRAIGVHAVPVVILGETGTGKEVVARALHAAYSGLKEKPFVPINCAALVETLAESTLFGHKRGAFSGADADRSGAFREAQGGTLFLDELGDMPLAIQAKMLRALESGEVRPVGVDSAVKVNTRIVAATNRDLEQAQDDGEFRSDLFNRLSVHVLRLRPLRERRDDILPLFRHFLRAFLNGPPPPIAPRAAELLVGHSWHRSNARGVRALAQAIATSDDSAPEEISMEIVTQHLHLHPEQGGAATTKLPPEGRLGLLEIVRDQPPQRREDLLRVLEAYSFNVTQTAKFFGISRKTVYNWCDKFAIDRPS